METSNPDRDVGELMGGFSHLPKGKYGRIPPSFILQVSRGKSVSLIVRGCPVTCSQPGLLVFWSLLVSW